jgi:HEAT repeat protein
VAKQSFEEKLARLRDLMCGVQAESAGNEIRKALSETSGILSAKAASAAAKLGLRDLVPEIAATFHRYLNNPVKTDPGCHAKLAAIEALNELDYLESDVFLRGIRHIQMEPSFGPPVDTADRLRGACATGLYRIGYPDIFCELVALLVDHEPVARRAAIKVLTELGNETSEMLLRYKCLQGDNESDIVGDCFSGLISIAPARSLRFIEQFFSSDNPEIVEEAALAIGNSRMKEGFALLQKLRDDSVLASFKRMLLLPIALTRCEEAFSCLLDVIRNEHPDNAMAAIEALSIYSNSDSLREQIRNEVFSRNHPAIIEVFEKKMG